MDETILFPLDIKSGRVVYQNRYQEIKKVIAEFEGFTKEYYVSDYGQRSAIMVIQGGKVLLTKQYRLLINDISLEIPGGSVNENETPEDAAMRECFEETGVRCQKIKPLIKYHLGLDTVKNYTYIFHTEDIITIPEENHDRGVWIRFVDCIDMVFNQKITDSLSILAILTYHTLVKPC